jgi:chromosome segregation ATPase
MKDPNKTTHRGVSNLSQDTMPEHPSDRDELVQELVELTAKYERLKEYARSKQVTMLERENAIVDLKIEVRKYQEEVRQIYNELQRTRARAAARGDYIRTLRTRLRRAKALYEELTSNYTELAQAYVEQVDDERLRRKVKRWLEKQ